MVIDLIALALVVVIFSLGYIIGYEMGQYTFEPEECHRRHRDE